MLVKVLERNWVIRLFGISLIFAPFINTYLTVKGLQTVPEDFNEMYWRVIRDGTVSYKILYLASIVIGALMMSGSVKAWRYALALLGGYIILQFSKIGHSFKTDKMSIVFFAVNVGLFFFIADQLVWKQRLPKSQEPTQPEQPVQPQAVAQSQAIAPSQPVSAQLKPANVTPIRKASRAKVIVHLDGFGNWAQLAGISGKGVHLKALIPNPPEMEEREIDLALRSDLVLRVRFKHRTDSDFYFDHVQLTSQKVGLLNQWLRQKAV
ncbi:MAG TPA: hypothetical protein VM432_02950 [Bdellovibrionales bacterium]|nr:hypothetical protein [Bdellovibrionales bacterium]